MHTCANGQAHRVNAQHNPTSSLAKLISCVLLTSTDTKGRKSVLLHEIQYKQNKAGKSRLSDLVAMVFEAI